MPQQPAPLPPVNAACLPVVIMGVSGSGKSTVAQALAARTGRPLAEGDAMHSAASVAKMSAGLPLTDEDRFPWLDTVGTWLAGAPGGIVACSALRRTYRDRLRGHAGDLLFVHVHTTSDLLRERLESRTDHFMTSSLLESQLRLLETLQYDERGVVLDAARPVADLVAAAVAMLDQACDVAPF